MSQQDNSSYKGTWLGSEGRVRWLNLYIPGERHSNRNCCLFAQNNMDFTCKSSSNGSEIRNRLTIVERRKENSDSIEAFEYFPTGEKRERFCLFPEIGDPLSEYLPDTLAVASGTVAGSAWRLLRGLRNEVRAVVSARFCYQFDVCFRSLVCFGSPARSQSEPKINYR